MRRAQTEQIGGNFVTLNTEDYSHQMPYCTSCGTEVPTNGLFCAHCGRPQPGAGIPPRAPVSGAGILDNVTPRTASILCYIPVFGIIPAIVVLTSQHFRNNAVVRFDAFQSVYLFVAWLIVSSATPVILLGFPEHWLVELFKTAFFICWIVLLIKASKNEQLRLPIIGDLAARSTTEQL